MTTEKLMLEMRADTKDLEKNLDKATKSIDELDKVSEKASGGIDNLGSKAKDTSGKMKPLSDEVRNSGMSLKEAGGFALTAAKGIATVTVAVGAAATAFIAYAKVQARSIIETEAMARAAGVSVQEFQAMSFALQTVGFDAEKFGDITKDTQERIGDFLATGGGPFQDFADVMGYTKNEATALAKEFETLSGPEVLQEMVTQMEDAGVSTQKMSFALEGMASDTTRLIPLLEKGGEKMKGLQTQFDKINVPLSDEEKQQFIDLSSNVDMAQTAFVNLINNAITPFLPAIASVAQGLAEVFASAQVGQDLDRIFDNPELIKQSKTLAEIVRFEERIAKERIDVNAKIANIDPMSGFDESMYTGDIERLAELDKIIEQRKAQIEEVNALAVETPEFEQGTLGTDTGGGGQAGSTSDSALKLESLAAELQAEEQASLTRLELLENERAARLAIAQAMVQDKQELKALEEEIEQSYQDKVSDLVASDEEKRAEQFGKRLAEQQQFLENKLISEEEYQQRLNEITEEYRPQDLDSDVLQTKYDEELSQLQESLNNKLTSNEDYLQKLDALNKKYLKKDEDRKKQGEFWSKSEVKTNLDAGVQILGALGGNSKKAFKIKQGLSAASAVMNTSEGVTKALASQNYAGAAVTAATGAAQLAAILSAKPDGGGGTIAPASASSSGSTDIGQTFTGEPTSTTITDITELTGTGQSTERFIIEFSDDVIDAVARKVKQSENDGRV